MSDQKEGGGTVRRLMRTLSRGKSTGRVPTIHEVRASSKDRERERGVALATSPPPASYFPPPPRATLRDTEATGAARHPDSSGARAADVGGPAQGAPGVSFAPSPAGRVRPNAELEGWNPPPRRTQSQRVRRTDNPSSTSSSGGLSRSRAGSASVAGANGGALGPPAVIDASAPRRGVQLEDKVLSRTTSVKRAATLVKKAVSSSFVPPAKAPGEKRVLILVADGSEEIEVLTPFDVFVRGGLGPAIVSVSPPFSPSDSLPYVTLSRGAKLMADTQFETLRQEIKDDFDAVIIPGGAKGAERLSQDKAVQKLVWSFFESGKLVGVICAGSLAAKTAGIALGGRITSHPSVKGDLEKHYDYSEDRVVVYENLVSSRGPGTALEFSLKIVEILAGKAKRIEVEGPMMI